MIQTNLRHQHTTKKWKMSCCRWNEATIRAMALSFFRKWRHEQLWVIVWYRLSVYKSKTRNLMPQNESNWPICMCAYERFTISVIGNLVKSKCSARNYDCIHCVRRRQCLNVEIVCALCCFTKIQTSSLLNRVNMHISFSFFRSFRSYSVRLAYNTKIGSNGWFHTAMRMFTISHFILTP